MKMTRIAPFFVLLALGMQGCLPFPPVEPQPAVPVVRVRIYHSAPDAERADTNLAKDAGAAAVGVVGTLAGADPLLAVLGYFAGQVALRAVERTSDGEFDTVTIDVPVPETGIVIITIPPDGTAQVIRQSVPDAPLGIPVGGTVEEIVERWLHADPEP